MDTVTVHYWPTETQSCATIQPHSFLITATLILSSCTTMMLCTSVWTDHWESMDWDLAEAFELLKTQNQSATKWTNNVQTEWLVNGTMVQITINSATRPSAANNGDALLVLATSNQNHYKNIHDPLLYEIGETATVILAPMYGGIWALCIALTDEQLVQLYRETGTTIGHILPKCVNYLNDDNYSSEEYFRPDWHHRMQNVSMSCALVCVIIVGTATLIGLFSICRNQISAMLVTAVLYLLAATFGLFTLGIMHNKHNSRKSHTQKNCNRSLALIDGMINAGGNMCQTIQFWEQLLTARIYSLDWSVNLGWIAVMFCALTSFSWIVLSKVMRNSPLIINSNN